MKLKAKHAHTHYDGMMSDNKRIKVTAIGKDMPINWPRITEGPESLSELSLPIIQFKDDDGARAWAQWKCWLFNKQIEEAAYEAARKGPCPKT